MAMQHDIDLVVGELEKAKNLYTTILDQVKRQDFMIKEIDENFVKPLKDNGNLWGFTLFAGGLPLETAEYMMRLEASIKQLDSAIEKARNLPIS